MQLISREEDVKTKPEEIAQNLSTMVDEMERTFPEVGFVVLAIMDHSDGGSSVVAVKNIDDEAFNTMVQQMALSPDCGLVFKPKNLN